MKKKQFEKRERKKRSSNPFKITAVLDKESLVCWKSIGNSSEWLRHELKYHIASRGLTLQAKYKRSVQELVSLKDAYDVEWQKVDSYYKALIYVKQKELEKYRDAIEEKKVQTRLTELKEEIHGT